NPLPQLCWVTLTLMRSRKGTTKKTTHAGLKAGASHGEKKGARWSGGKNSSGQRNKRGGSGIRTW
ncbi:hypothetical protein BaRGS_00011604, partial [Batillaria attramentaria]